MTIPTDKLTRVFQAVSIADTFARDFAARQARVGNDIESRIKFLERTIQAQHVALNLLTLAMDQQAREYKKESDTE